MIVQHATRMTEKSRMKLSLMTRLLVLAAVLPLASAHADDRDDSPDVELVGVPLDLPGHEEAPRSRPHAAPEPADEPIPTDDARDWFGGRPFLEWDRLTGDWASARSRLERAGLTIEASYLFEWSGGWSGGASGRAHTRSLFDFNATLDFDRAFNWNGATAFFDFYSTHKTGGSGDIGDFQGFSNLETDRSVDQIAELWIEQILLEGALRLKVGKIEANSEFAFLDSAVEFINSSAGFSPTIVGLPSYPDPSTGVVAQVFPVEHSYISLGVFDGAAAVDGVRTGTRGPSTFFNDDKSDDYFLIAEAGAGWELVDARPGRFAMGVWHHTGAFTTFDGAAEDGTTGFYALAEQRLWSREDADSDSGRGLYLFGQFGWADEDVSEAELHAGVGASLLGTFASREDDAAGVYISWVKLSDEAGFDEDETAIEVFYRLQLTPWVSLKPDLQLIFNPGGDPDLDTAVVGSLRLEIVF